MPGLLATFISSQRHRSITATAATSNRLGTLSSRIALLVGVRPMAWLGAESPWSGGLWADPAKLFAVALSARETTGMSVPVVDCLSVRHMGESLPAIGAS